MNTFKPGIYDIEDHEYHTSEGISRSGIMLFKKSPMHYWNKYKNPNRSFEDDTTPQQLLGKAAHCILLEPQEFENRYFSITEKLDRRTKAGKEKWEALHIEHEGKQILTTDMYEQVINIRDSVNSDKYAAEFLKGAQVEKSIYWKDCNTNVLCKARPDIWHANMICDIKTTNDASSNSFQRSMAQYGYHIQAAMIQDGIHHIQHNRITDYVFIAIETVAPYAVGIYILDKESIQRGHDEYKAILEDFREYNEKDLPIWPSYKPSVI